MLVKDQKKGAGPLTDSDKIEIHKVMLVKIFFTKHDLLMELSPFRFIQILPQEQSDLNVCLKFSTPHFSPGKFHLLTAAIRLLKTNLSMKKSINKPELAMENGEHYENRIPMRLWAEDDLPSQKLLLKGTGSLSDAELLSLIIGSGISGENSLDIAKKMLVDVGNSLCEFWKFSVSDLQKIKGIGEKRAVKISAMFALARRRNESEVILKDKDLQEHRCL